MLGTDALIEDLMRADGFILAGLATFDRLFARLNAEEIARASERMAADGLGQDAIDAFAEARADGTKLARGQYHRDLWILALPYVADSLIAAIDVDVLPGSVLKDLLTADACVLAILGAVDELQERRLARLRSLLLKHGSEEEIAGADVEVDTFRQGLRQGRHALHRELWRLALRCITLDAAAEA